MDEIAKENNNQFEQDFRFPSGKWTGFFIQKNPPLGKQWMDLLCTFNGGILSATGNDVVGSFVFNGAYDLITGVCKWNKIYVGNKLPVYYEGYNEGKGIWGTWLLEMKENQTTLKGGFHIWPEGMAVTDDDRLSAELEVPIKKEKLKPMLVPSAKTIFPGY